MIQPEWRNLLEASVQKPGGSHWLAHLHLGLMYYSVGNSAAAEDEWQRSLRRCPSGWGLRNLAVLRKIKGRYDEAVSFYYKAHQLLPTLRPLLVEYCESLLAANRPEEVLALIESLPKQIGSHSRVRLLEARAGLALDLPDRCRPILRDDYELVDIREGETSLTDMWFALQSRLRDGGKDQILVNGSNKSLDSHLRLPSALDFQVMPHPHIGAFPYQHARRHDPLSQVGLR